MQIGGLLPLGQLILLVVLVPGIEGLDEVEDGIQSGINPAGLQYKLLVLKYGEVDPEEDSYLIGDKGHFQHRGEDERDAGEHPGNNED